MPTVAHIVSAERLTVANELLARGIEEKLFTHAVYALARGGTRIALKAFGEAKENTVFDLASLTKPMATATCLMQLSNRAKIIRYFTFG